MADFEYNTINIEEQETGKQAEYDMSKYDNYKDESFVPNSYTLLASDLREKYKILSREEQDKIIREIKSGNMIRKDELMCSNMPLVVSRAKKYFPLADSIWEITDLIQEGYLGMERALDLYDIDKDEKANFTTYAVYWIDQRISRFLYENNSTVHIPVHALTKYKKAKRLMAKGRSKEEAFASAEITQTMFDNITQILNKISLNRPMDVEESDSGEFGDFVKDEKILVDFGCVDADTMERIIDIMKKKLKPKEFEVFARRIGINGVSAETLESIARTLGVTRERVRQIEKRAVDKIKPSVAKMYDRKVG